MAVKTHLRLVWHGSKAYRRHGTDPLEVESLLMLVLPLLLELVVRLQIPRVKRHDCGAQAALPRAFQGHHQLAAQAGGAA